MLLDFTHSCGKVSLANIIDFVTSAFRPLQASCLMVMDLRTVLFSLAVMSVAALCSAAGEAGDDVPQDQLTWRSVRYHSARVSVRNVDEELSGDGAASGSGSEIGSGEPTKPPIPTLAPTERFAGPPFLSGPECSTAEAGLALPARSLEQLQLHAMCELTCIVNTVSVAAFSKDNS